MGSLERNSKKKLAGEFRIVFGDRQYRAGFHVAARLPPNLKTCKRKWMFVALRERYVHSIFVAIARNMVEINKCCSM